MRAWRAVALVLLSCTAREEPPDQASSTAEAWPRKPDELRIEPEEVERDPTLAEPVVPRRKPSCEERIADVRRLPAHSGACVSEDCRSPLLLAVKAEPVLFYDPPEPDPEIDERSLRYRRWLEQTSEPAGVVAQVLHELRNDPARLRAVFLTDGYLFAERVMLAAALVDALRAEVLFRDKEIWLQRGAFTWHATRDPERKRYYFDDGPRAGRPVSLILFDRVGAGTAPRAPLHRDLRTLRDELGFDRLNPLHLTPQLMLVELRYGRHWVPTLLESRGARLERACELPPEGSALELETVRKAARRRTMVWRSLQTAITQQIDDQLPFDEPRHEVGQEDGKLRALWLEAYEEGKLAYRYRDDEYPVFDERGRPLVPQVCVDFLIDTLEIAAGTWWHPRGEAPGRSRGKFAVCPTARPPLRRISELEALARDRPDQLDALEIGERIPMGHEVELSAYLRSHADDFIPGDVVFIGGDVPWDRPHHAHYHSFFIFESDPLTGMPLSIAGNAGRPSLRTWMTEMRRTPSRTLRLRIRLDTEWLETIVEPAKPEALGVPPFLSQT